MAGEAAPFTGQGTYSWIDIHGHQRHGHHWDDLPAEMDRLITFVPDSPPEPHSAEEHALMETFGAKLQEALGRCRR